MTPRALVCFVALGVVGCNRPAPPQPMATSSAPDPSANGTPTAAVPPAPSTPAGDGAGKPASDGAVDALVQRLAKSHGLWANGHFPKLGLPLSSKTHDVLTEMFRRVSFGKGNVSTFTILEEREVTIGDDARPYRAARLQTDQGDMVVLLRFDRSWWSRAFEE